MSTRCQIKVNDKEDMIYKHCDGVPSKILPVLIKIVNKGIRKNIKDENYYLFELLNHFSRNCGEEEKMFNSITKSFKENDRFKIVNNNDISDLTNSNLFITDKFYNYAFLYKIDLENKIIEVSGYEDFKFDIESKKIVCDSKEYSKEQQKIREKFNKFLFDEKEFENIDYDTYSILYNRAMVLFDEMYKLGYKEGVNNE